MKIQNVEHYESHCLRGFNIDYPSVFTLDLIYEICKEEIDPVLKAWDKEPLKESLKDLNTDELEDLLDGLDNGDVVCLAEKLMIPILKPTEFFEVKYDEHESLYVINVYKCSVESEEELHHILKDALQTYEVDLKKLYKLMIRG